LHYADLLQFYETSTNVLWPKKSIIFAVFDFAILKKENKNAIQQLNGI
jgi:hypothetical protein